MRKYTPKLTIAERFWSKVAITANPDLCWEWQASTNRYGYGTIKDNRIVKRSHRVSWELTNGAIPEKLFVLHTCDNRKCVNPKHLFLGTNQDNMTDMVFKFRGNGPCGENNPNHKLTAKLVAEIRLRYTTEKITQKELARQYGVSQSTIGNIVQWNTW